MSQNPGYFFPFKGIHVEQYYVDFLFGSKIRGCCGEFPGTFKRREKTGERKAEGVSGSTEQQQQI